jgi:hypothetical protein
MVSSKVARATDGAALNRPAKLLGLKISPKKAKSETERPPYQKSNQYVFHLPQALLRWLVRRFCWFILHNKMLERRFGKIVVRRIFFLR